MKTFNVGVIGATGLVGQTIIEILVKRNFPIEKLYLFASERSKGSEVKYKNEILIVEELKEENLPEDLDLVFMAAGGAVSKVYGPILAKQGVKVVDNSSVFRMKEDIPLVVPEINSEDVKKNNIVANPNCSTIQSVLPLKPLYDKFGIKRVVYSSYQSVSGSGIGGLKDLAEGTKLKYPYKIQNNLIPHIDDFLDNRYTKEEMKMIEETRKILGDKSIRITATTVRVPVKYAHAVSINVELKKEFKLEEVFEAFEKYPGIVVEDNIEENIYPMPRKVEGKDEVFVGRIRRDYSVDNGINFFSVADNIRKGAALNTVQIGEEIIKYL